MFGADMGASATPRACVRRKNLIYLKKIVCEAEPNHLFGSLANFARACGRVSAVVIRTRGQDAERDKNRGSPNLRLSKSQGFKGQDLSQELPLKVPFNPCTVNWSRRQNRDPFSTGGRDLKQKTIGLLRLSGFPQPARIRKACP